MKKTIWLLRINIFIAFICLVLGIRRHINLYVMLKYEADDYNLSDQNPYDVIKRHLHISIDSTEVFIAFISVLFVLCCITYFIVKKLNRN